MTFINDILTPKLCGEITAMGNWNGYSDFLDIYHDIARAVSFLPSGHKPYYILMNPRTEYYINVMNADHEPVYVKILIHIFDVRPSEVTCFKEYIIRTSDKIPNDIALVISDSNDVVIIHTNG